MVGSIRVGRPNRIHHIPLSWDVSKARSNHQPKFRPVGEATLRGREKTVGQTIELMFAEMPSVERWITGEIDAQTYLDEARDTSEPFRLQVAEILQRTYNDGALESQDRIRASMNQQLERLGSPLRLTGADGRVTKGRRSVTTARVEEISPDHVYRNQLSRWSPIDEQAFNTVNADSVRYAQRRSATLVTNMVDEQQRVIQGLIGESFTAQQTFTTGRTVTGLTAQQTSQALVNVLQEVNPTTSVGQNLAMFRGVNANGLTAPWERAVYHRAERMADALAKQGVTGVKAQMKVQKAAQRHADKLRRSRARMISRTEIKNAQVQGQLSAMRQAVNDGLADPATAGKQWVTGATDVCPICSELGFGKPIPLDQSFEGGFDGPTAHPNCKCDVNFVHTLSQAPMARAAHGPGVPRPGTPGNPITWEFPGGFKTQPSATTSFLPPGFVPPVPAPPPVVPAATQAPRPPVDPPAPAQVPVKPAESLSPNAEIVWDDAGRKWADLTDDERWFLWKSHTEDIVRQSHDEASAALVAETNPPVTRPPLADDAPEPIKEIYRQADRVDELKLREARHSADQQLFFTETGQFNPNVFADNIVTWADEATQGSITATEARLASRARLVDAGSDGMPIPGSTRRLIFESDTGRDLLDPDGPLSRSDLQDAVLRIIKSQDDLAPSVLAELETEITRLGTLVRAEAQGRAAAAAPPDSWVSRLAVDRDGRLQQLRVKEMHEVARGEILVADSTIVGIRESVGKIPSRHKAISVTSKADEIVYEAFHTPYETALRGFVRQEIEDAGGATLRSRAIGRTTSGRLNLALAEDGTLDAAEEAIRHILRAFDDLIDEGLMTPEQALARIDPLRGGPRLAGVPDKPVHYRLGQYLDEVAEKRLEEARHLITQELGRPSVTQTVVGDLDDWVDDVMERLASFWAKGNVSNIAGHHAYIAVQQQLIDLAGMLSVGTEADVVAVLVGKWSQVGTGGDIRMAINEVLRQVRLLGDETFNYVTGTNVGHYQGYKGITPRVREALDSMEEAVELWMPTDWITRSNARGDLGFYGRSSRASYVDTAHVSGASGHYTAVGDGLIDIGRTGKVPSQSTMLHEVTHRAQRGSPLHEELERRWWQRRLDASPLPEQREIRRMSEIAPLRGYRASEKAATDEFIDNYIGKVYGPDATGRVSETSTMAMEHLAGLPGSRGHALTEDWDMVDWFVGMLAGV